MCEPMKNETELFPLNKDFLDKTFSSVGRVKNFKIVLCHRSEVRDFIEYWHYSKNINGLTTDYCFKLLDEASNLIGAIIYGKIAMANVWKKYANKEADLIELKRLCCINNTPKNTESFFIGGTLKWLKKNTNIKTVISYADTTYGHSGGIYKATNFASHGMTAKGRVIMYEGKRYHDKTIRTKYNGELKPFANKIKNALLSGDAQYIDTKGKHIFIYNLTK